MFKRIAVTLGALTLLLAAPAFSQGHPMERGPRGPQPGREILDPAQQVERMKHALDLTEEQVQQMEQLVGGLADSRTPQRERIVALRGDLRMLQEAETFDEAAVREVAGELAEIQTNQIVERARMMSELRHILTPDQLSRLDELQTTRGQRRHPRPRR